MSTVELEDMIREADAALSVLRDIVLVDATKERAQQAVQLLLVHAKNALLTAKQVAVPHKLPVEFCNMSLRYPQDCDAGLKEEKIKEYRASEDKGYRDFADEVEQAMERLEPKFLSDEIWSSSDNCSEQGFNLFSLDDFTVNRGW